MRFLLFFIGLGIGIPPVEVNAASPLQITEISAAGRQGLRDEDDETPDWIEIQNRSAESVNLEGWVLELRANRSKAWQSPATNLPPGGFLVVFASSKDRRTAGRPLHANFKLPTKGGSLVLRGPGNEESRLDLYPSQVAGVTFGLSSAAEPSENRAVLIGETTRLRYFLPTNNRLGTNWLAPDFDDSRWARGRNGIGYDNRGNRYGELLKTDLGQRMPEECSSLYLRIPLVATNASRATSLRLLAQYDDGFVAWLNGREVVRRNAPETVAWDSLAEAVHHDDKSREIEEIPIRLQAQLSQGTNWLCVHVLNSSPRSNGLFFRAGLLAGDWVPSSVSAQEARYSYLSVPTPGRRNAAAVGEGPRIEWLGRDSPSQPRTDESIPLTAHITAVSDPIAEVQLIYRVLFGPEIALPMVDDGAHGDGRAGDGIYGAAIPPKTALPGQMLRYAVAASDREGRQSRWPLFANRARYSAYEGTVIADPSVRTRLPVLQLFTGKEQRPGQATPKGSVSAFFQGELYDNVAMRTHGQISRGFPKQSYNLNFPRDHHCLLLTNQSRLKGLRLMANYADKSKIRNTLAYEMIAASGSVAHLAFPVRVERNGKFFSVAEVIEDGDEDWLRRVHLDPLGALYKMNNNLTGTQGADKKTRGFEGAQDLAALIRGLSEERPLEQRAAFGIESLDLPQCVSYLVAMTLISSDDHGHKNYYLYRDSRGTGLWALLPWDVDLSWGRNWTGQYFDETVFVDNPLDLYRNGRRKPRNRLYNLLLSYSDFRQMYLRRLRTVMDDLLQPPGTRPDSLFIEQRVRQLMDQVDPSGIKPSDADLDNAAWPSWGRASSPRKEAQKIISEYLPGRRQFLFTNPRATLAGNPIPPAQLPTVTVEIARIELGHAAQDQSVCLTNRNPVAVDISGWRMDGAGVQFAFHPGTVIPSGKALHAVADLMAFRRLLDRSTADAIPPVAQGNWHGALVKDLGSLRLIDSNGRLVASRVVEENP